MPEELLNNFVGKLNIIRQPLAKLETAGSPKILQFPQPIFYPTVPPLGWTA